MNSDYAIELGKLYLTIKHYKKVLKEEISSLDTTSLFTLRKETEGIVQLKFELAAMKKRAKFLEGEVMKLMK